MLGVSEVRWLGSGEVQYEKSKFLYSGGDRSERGVGVLMSKMQQRVLEVTGLFQIG